MIRNKLEDCAGSLVARDKGILAADESFPTIEKRFKSVGIASTEENRRAYRETLFTTPGLGDFISGVILFDETIRQKARDGTPLVAVLARQGILPGIKVDKGTVALAGFPGEKITEGLDGLRHRLEEYRTLGASLRQMAGGDYHRRQSNYPDARLSGSERPRPRSLCGVVARSGTGAHR